MPNELNGLQRTTSVLEGLNEPNAVFPPAVTNANVTSRTPSEVRFWLTG
jgi:hypothetical protein